MDPAAARERLDLIVAAERADRALDPRSFTRGWLPAGGAPLGVVLIHGFTSAPHQYAALGDLLAGRGHAVVVPRVRGHGHRDRLTDALDGMTVDDWTRAALVGIGIAALAAERVVIAGISVGAVAAAWCAPRVALARAVCVAPFFGVRFVPGDANVALGAALRALPQHWQWWDPRRRTAQLPTHAYPRFPTRALGACLALGAAAVPPTREPVRAEDLRLVLNPHEPAVDNRYAGRVIARLAARTGIPVRTSLLPPATPAIHDVVEPTIPQARIDLTYPVIVDAIEGR